MRPTQTNKDGASIDIVRGDQLSEGVVKNSGKQNERMIRRKRRAKKGCGQQAMSSGGIKPLPPQDRQEVLFE
jgi:hypothetical protein